MRRNTQAVLISLVMFMFIGCATSERQFRKPGIPPTAVWVGSREGGNWIFCEAIDAQGQRRLCKVFDGRSGQTLSSGEYVLRSALPQGSGQRSEPTAVNAPPQQLVFQGFDGKIISAEDGLVLLPDGWIDYPKGGGGHGEKKQYELGIETGAPRPY